MALTTASFVEGGWVEGNASTTSDTLPLDTGAQAGDWHFLACSLTAAGGTFTTPAGWTAIAGPYVSTASTSHTAVVYARKWVAGDSDPVVNHSSGRFAGMAVRVRDADTTNFLDTTVAVDTSAAVGATTISAPSQTPGTANAVLVTVHTARTSTNGDYITIAAPTGMTRIDFECSTTTSSNAAVATSIVAQGSGVASGAKVATPDAATNGAIGISFVVRNAQAGTLAHVTATAASAWNVVGRITDTQASAWNVRELAHITATVASAWNVVGRLTDTQASAWNVRSATTKTANAAWNVNSAVGGGAPIGQFMVRYVAYAPNGARLGVLGQPFDSTAGLPLNDVGALQISYSTAAAGFSFISSPCEIGMEWSINGAAWAEAPNARFLRIKRSDNTTDPTGKVTYDCPGYAWLLGKAKIYPNAATDNVDGKRPFANARPGQLLKALIDEAKARGALAGMTYDFTEGLDSAGQAWATTATIMFDIGADLLSILQSLCDQGIVDYCTQGRVLRVFNPNAYLARDVTTGAAPVTLRLGRDVADAPDTGTLEDVVTDLVVLGDLGVKTTLTNAAAVSPWGRWESFLSESGVTDVPTMTVLGNSALLTGQQERIENTRALTFAGAVWLPFNNYRMGDYVKAPGDDGSLQTLRVTNLTVTTDSNGAVAGNVTLNDRFLDKQLRDSRRLAGITSGALGTGGTGKTPAPPVGTDKTIPAAPAGLGYTTDYYQTPDGTSYALVNLTWGAVSVNTDGTVMTDFRGYEVWQRQYAVGAIWHRRTFVEGTDTTLTASPFDPGSQWQFTIKARDITGHPSANSNVVTVTMASDTTAPNAPSAPVITPYLGQLIVSWDGKDSSGANQPNDWLRTEVHMSATTSGFTPSTATLKGAMISRNGGQFLLSGLTYGQQYYVRLVAVDRVGNVSAASAQATGTPARVANVDVGDGTINGVKIQPGTITAAMALFQAAAIQRADIALLAVDDARIANLNAGKITTGEIDAATRIIAGHDGTPHAEMRADGFAVVQYDSNGAAYDAIRMGNATTNFITIPDQTNPETTLASIDESGMASFQGLDVSGVDNTDTGFTVYGQEFSDWIGNLPSGNAAFLENAGSTTPIDATAEITVAEISFTYVEGRHFVVWWNGMHYYSGTSIVGGQFRMVYTSDGTQPSATHGATAATQFVVPNNTTSIGNFGTSPPLGASGDWGNDGDTIRVAITARRYYGTGIFNVLTSGGATYQQPYRMWVDDTGPLQPNAWVTPGGTSKKTYVKTFPATWTRLYNGSGVARSDTFNALQGYIATYGDNRTFIGFADMTSALSGVAAGDIKKIEVYLYCHWTAYTTGGTARIGFHGFSTSPTTMPSTTVQLSTHFNRPQGRWVSLPLTTPGNWITGTWRGITLGPGGSTSPTYYMRFHGFSDSTYKPAMRITYAK